MLYLSARFPPSVPDGQVEWARPYRIMSGDADGRFSFQHTNLMSTDSWIFLEHALDLTINRSDFGGVFSMEDIINSGPILLFEYPFPMDSETFVHALGHRSAADLAAHGVNRFTGIGVIPPEDDETLIVYFFYREDAWEFRSNLGLGEFRIENLEIKVLPEAPQGVHFEFVDGDFSPRFPTGFWSNSITLSNPFQNAAGLLTLSSIRPQIEVFFDNPATINPSASAGTYTYSNINTMVRYLPFDVLVYMNYRTIARVAPANLLTDFSAALAFIRRDVNVTNEKYLAGYEERGREHVFWFNYVTEGFIAEIDEPWFTAPMCQDPLMFPIEVVVDHGRVVRYRRIAFNFDTEGSVFNLPSENPYIRLAFKLSAEPVINLSTVLAESGYD